MRYTEDVRLSTILFQTTLTQESNTMSDSTSLHNLEARVAFQEQSIDQLSDALARQELELEKMSRMIHHLGQRIKELSDGNPLGEDNQPPPHY